MGRRVRSSVAGINDKRRLRESDLGASSVIANAMLILKRNSGGFPDRARRSAVLPIETFR
jgi:hypothetical protein